MSPKLPAKTGDNPRQPAPQHTSATSSERELRQQPNFGPHAALLREQAGQNSTKVALLPLPHNPTCHSRRLPAARPKVPPAPCLHPRGLAVAAPAPRRVLPCSLRLFIQDAATGAGFPFEAAIFDYFFGVVRRVADLKAELAITTLLSSGEWNPSAAWSITTTCPSKTPTTFLNPRQVGRCLC